MEEERVIGEDTIREKTKGAVGAEAHDTERHWDPWFDLVCWSSSGIDAAAMEWDA